MTRSNFTTLPYRYSQDACWRHYRFSCCPPSRRHCECAAYLPSPCVICAASRSIACRPAPRIGRAASTTGSRHCQTRPSRCSWRNSWRRCRSAPTLSNFASWLRGLVLPRSSTPRWGPSHTETARSQSRGCVNSTTVSPQLRTARRRWPSRSVRAPTSWASPRRLPRIALTSTQERPHEICRDQPVRGLRCADLADDGRRLARHDRIAPGRRPLRFAAIRLASGPVRVCRVRHRSLVMDPDCRAMRFVVSSTEVTSNRGKTPDDRDAGVSLVRRIQMTAPFLITLAAVALAGLLGWAMWGVYMGHRGRAM